MTYRFPVAFCVLGLLLPLASTAQAADKPNVLFIAIDDLNHWVGYMGRNKQTATPNIDRLAARGVRFTNAYCAAPSCTPSRAALMSGMRPGTTGVYENYNDWSPAVPVEKCLPAQFRGGGYATFAAGKIYHGGTGRPGEHDQMREYDGNPNHPAGIKPKRLGDSDGVGGIKFAPIANPDNELQDYHTVDWCIEQLSKNHDKPFIIEWDATDMSMFQGRAEKTGVVFVKYEGCELRVLDCTVAPDRPAKYEPITADAFLTQRLREIGLIPQART